MDDRKPQSDRLNLIRAPKARLSRAQAGMWTVPVTIVLGILIWAAVSKWSGLPAFILPSPIMVGNRFLQLLGDGSLARHTWATLSEVVGGLILGVLAATVLG